MSRGRNRPPSVPTKAQLREALVKLTRLASFADRMHARLIERGYTREDELACNAYRLRWVLNDLSLSMLEEIDKAPE